MVDNKKSIQLAKKQTANRLEIDCSPHSSSNYTISKEWSIFLLEHSNDNF